MYHREVLVKIDDVLSGIGREIGGLGYERIMDCYVLEVNIHVVYSRASEILGGFWSQTPPLSLTQNVTAYQFMGP